MTDWQISLTHRLAVPPLPLGEGFFLLGDLAVPSVATATALFRHPFRRLLRGQGL